MQDRDGVDGGGGERTPGGEASHGAPGPAGHPTGACEEGVGRIPAHVTAGQRAAAEEEELHVVGSRPPDSGRDDGGSSGGGRGGRKGEVT